MPTTCTWYLDVLDNERSNEIVGKFLGEMADENECNNQLCSDGEKRNLWRMPRYAIMNHISQCLARKKLPFHTFRKRGQHGEIEACSLGGSVAMKEFATAPF